MHTRVRARVCVCVRLFVRVCACLCEYARSFRHTCVRERQSKAAAPHPGPPLPPPSRNRECLSLGCDEAPLFWGRTPVEMVRDFVEAFSDAFDYLFGEEGVWLAVGWRLGGNWAVWRPFRMRLTASGHPAFSISPLGSVCWREASTDRPPPLPPP